MSRSSEIFTLLVLAVLCASIGHYGRTSDRDNNDGDREEGKRSRKKCSTQGYLSFSKEDVGDDVREAAAQHQHHAVLAVCYTRHLETRDIIYCYTLKYSDI